MSAHDYRRCYVHGANAHDGGRPRTFNPYTGREERAAWFDGWDAAAEESEARQAKQGDDE